MEGNSPSTCTCWGRPSRNWIQMARLNKHQRDLNTTDRLTPFDVRTRGTFSEVPRPEKGPPRRPSAAETHANNYAKVDTGRLVGDLREWIPLFAADLEDMNRGKRGRPYDYSDALILWLMTYMSFSSMDFRGAIGLFGPVLEHFGIAVPSFTRFFERSTKLSLSYLLDDGSGIKRMYGKGVYAVQCCKNVTDRVRRVGIDSSGLSLSCHNRWRETKWHEGPKRRGWLHFHMLCDVDSGEMIAYALTDDTVGDAPLLKLLVSVAAKGGHKFEKVYADGAYCSDENWRFLCRDNGYVFVTSFKVNTSPTSNGCLARGEAASRWCSLPYHEWARVSGYGIRWKCECVFSDFKRLFPETVQARSAAGYVREVASRIDVFNLYKSLRSRLMGVTGNGVQVA